MNTGSYLFNIIARLFLVNHGLVQEPLLRETQEPQKKTLA